MPFPFFPLPALRFCCNTTSSKKPAEVFLVRKARLFSHLVACSLAHFHGCLNPHAPEGCDWHCFIFMCVWVSVVRQGTDGVVGRWRPLCSSSTMVQAGKQAGLPAFLHTSPRLNTMPALHASLSGLAQAAQRSLRMVTSHRLDVPLVQTGMYPPLSPSLMVSCVLET